MHTENGEEKRFTQQFLNIQKIILGIEFLQYVKPIDEGWKL